VWHTVTEDVSNFIGGVISLFTGIGDTIIGFFGGIGTGITNVFSGVAGVVGGIVQGIVNVAKGIIDTIINAINAVIGIIDAVQVHVHFGPVNMDWSGLNLPKIPLMDAGGVITSPGLVAVGASAVPETFTPAGASGPSGGGSTTINNYVTSNDPQSLVNILVRYCQQHGAIQGVTVGQALRVA
jgi:hypothetical protein